MLWGVVYYAWMVLIAGIVVKWKEERLDLEFEMHDSYWFAYISTTTVGLGDYYLEPGGIIGPDLATFPLLFLVGFMLLAAFFGKFSEIIVGARRGRKSFVSTLLDMPVRWKDTFAGNEESLKSSRFATEQ